MTESSYDLVILFAIMRYSESQIGVTIYKLCGISFVGLYSLRNLNLSFLFLPLLIIV